MPAPKAEFSDGFLDLALIKDCPKSALVSISMKIRDGTHVNSPYVIYLKVKAFKLFPGNRVDEPKKGGIVDVDGEVIARGEGTYASGQDADLMAYGPPIEVTVDQGLAMVFSPIDDQQDQDANSIRGQVLTSHFRQYELLTKSTLTNDEILTLRWLYSSNEHNN
ncbi:hypothetical protein HPP92_001808 [Vanilla planifolia]|uniref:YegS/DAGK C-terminal domain-containing protein n=1 Tax=Vanilla planifolia TaxID=51239 RepID=A0A835S4Z6_VANPL|nr:hypothetical protein HPP92_001808 [Vanilla planifolia]